MATRTPETARYTRVAMWLHWLIAFFIFYNLASGLLRSELPRGFFVFHISSGITILALTLVRVVWRLTHRPPPFLPIKVWDARLAHSVHFLLYLAMLLMPLSGWAMISANPPAGSPGAAYADAERAARQAAEPQRLPAGGEVRTAPAPAGEGKGGGAAPRPRGPTMLWGLVKLPLITPINELGRTPEGLPEQREVHERTETFHAIGGWIMLLLLVLHIAGALKHQFADRQPELQRMGLDHPGRRRVAAE